MSQLSNEQIAEMMEAYSENRDASYEKNLNTLGAIDLENPTSINIYPKDFESKDNITTAIEEYNQKQRNEGKEENVISYTDLVGVMMNSVSQIINTISYVLIAFVAISLIVSSIMIGIITYISVLERTKEIGILRAIGASKKDISRVFNAETFIVGLISGLLGIGITILLTIPINAAILLNNRSRSTCNGTSKSRYNISYNKYGFNNDCRINSSKNGQQKRPSRGFKNRIRQLGTVLICITIFVELCRKM